MSIPNTVLKIISKTGAIVDFDIERIRKSIRGSIVDVAGSPRWLPDMKAEQYAQKVAARVYREFYDSRWLLSDFIVKFANYKPDERNRRLAAAFVTSRLRYVMLERFKDEIPPGEDPRKHEAKLRAFVENEVRTAKVDPHYTEGLFPRLGDAEIKEIAPFLVAQVLEIADSGKLPPDAHFPHREYIQDLIEKELKDIGEVDVAEAYMIFREGRRKIHAGEITETQFTNNGIPREIVNRTMRWNIEHECETIFALNDWVHGRHGKKLPELIEACERRYHGDVRETAARILERKDEIRVVVIAGPSCSNKTTTTVIIGQELQRVGLKLKQLNVDNYFYDLTQQPKDEFGDYDFEMPEAIDIPLLNEHLATLLDGKPIQMPYYNFKLGRRDGTSAFAVADDEVILIDCLHGLHRNLTASVPARAKFRIYIESMNVLRNTNGDFTKWADVRMLKRMMRDSAHRGYGASHTLAHWPYVRKGELKHIIPYIFTTDAILNSGLPYEIPVLKNTLKGKYPTREFIDELYFQGRLDPYIRGMRVANILDTVAEIPSLDLVPPTSPIREFIGGSTYVIPHNE